MAKTRSENNAVGNSKFTDLNMTFYPTKIDSKVTGADGHNTNMKGFWSAGDTAIPVGQEADYNMAEHVNALADAVIAVQRILGINPHVDTKGANTTGTVSTRIGAVENKDAYYDNRYGGVNWTTALGQTILTHRHGGASKNQAPQISLTTEVTGMLPKAFVNLTASVGITGQDLFMSPSISTKVSDAIGDKLSVAEGGIIQKDLEVVGKFSSRTYREWAAKDITTGGQVTDVATLHNQARRYSGTTEQAIIAAPLTNMLAGKYVLGVRVKVNTRVAENVLRLSFSEYKQSPAGWVSKATTYVKGEEFDAVNKWQMFYLVFDHEPVDATGFNGLRIMKNPSLTAVNLDFDCAWVMPIHPAVFDK